VIPKMKWLVPVFLAFTALAFGLFLPVFSHAETPIVKAGDEAAVQFTCHLPNGDVAASSYQSVAENKALKKSAVFWRRTVNTPIEILAGNPSAADISAAERSLEDEILYRLAGAIVGFRTGEKTATFSS